MKLNNEISQLKMKEEDIKQRKLTTQEEELTTAALKLNKVNQIARIMLSIDFLEQFCKYKNIKCNHENL